MNPWRYVLVSAMGIAGKMSRNSSFEELRSRYVPGVDFTIEAIDRGSALLIAAPHGGGIEPGTGEIALALAGEEFSCYVFDGARLNGNQQLHIASTRFDESRYLSLARNASMVLTVHGCKGDHEAIYIGGLQKDNMYALRQVLRKAGFRAYLDISRHSGSSLRNICNLGRSGKGIQLEITVGLRKNLFAGLHRQGRAKKTSLFTEFISAVRSTF